MNSKDSIKRNFSRYAAYYDTYAGVQFRAGAKLITGIGTEEFKKILDIGCGTGNYTRLLRNKFGAAVIMAVDISGKMIEIARGKLQDQNIEFVTADAETATLGQGFDLITSNVCFQWFANPEEAIVKYRNLLTDGGTILFSIFGPLTFCELSESLGWLYEEDVQLSSDAFMDAERLSMILEENFGSVSVNVLISKERYGCLWELLRTIKYTGTQGAGLNGRYLSKGRLAELEKIYKERFNGITATYQIFYCRAQRRG